jgi:hypothetical protein
MNFLNKSWSAALPDRANEIKEFYESTRRETWKNEEISLFHIRSVSKKGLTGYVFAGGYGSKGATLSIKKETLPEEYYPDVEDTGIMLIRNLNFHDNEVYLIDQSVLTDLGKVTGLTGPALYEQGAERDIFLTVLLLNKGEEEHTFIIRQAGNVKKIVAIRNRKFEFLTYEELFGFVDAVCQNEGLSITGGKVTPEVTSVVLSDKNTACPKPAVRISDSMTGDSSLTVETGYLFGDVFATVMEISRAHRSKLDPMSMLDETSRIWQEMRQKLSHYTITRVGIQDAMGEWKKSPMFLKNDVKCTHFPSMEQVAELLYKTGTIPVPEFLKNFGTLAGMIEPEYAAKHEVSVGLGNVLRTAFGGRRSPNNATNDR